MTEADAIEAMMRVLHEDDGEFDPDWPDEYTDRSVAELRAQATRLLDVLLEGQYVLLRDQLEEVGALITSEDDGTYFAWPFQARALEAMGYYPEPVFRLLPAETQEPQT